VSLAGTPTGQGYDILHADGSVEAFGDGRSFGNLGTKLDGAAVAIVATQFDSGYWVLDAAGGVHAFGAAPRPPSRSVPPSQPAAPAPAARAAPAASAPGSGLPAPKVAVPCPGHDAIGLAAAPADRGDVVACADGTLVGAGSLAALTRRVALATGERLVGIAADPATGGLWLATSFGSVVTVEPAGAARSGLAGLSRIAAIAAA
jgi:hypothetical protein